MPFMILLLFSLQLSASPLSSGQFNSESFYKFADERAKFFEELVDKTSRDEFCPGVDFSCVVNELKKAQIRTANDLSFGIQLLTYVRKRKFIRDNECHEMCRINLNAQFLDSALTYLESFELKELMLYKDFQGKENKLKFMRANEDLQAYAAIQRFTNFLHSLERESDANKIFKPDLAEKSKSFHQRIQALKKAEYFKNSELSKLELKSEAYKGLLKLPKTKEEKARQLELLSKFNQAYKIQE